MADEERVRRLVDVARLYYVEKVTKTRIANKLNTSATQIGRLLKEAELEGIVRFDVCPPTVCRLQDSLVTRFECLREAVVVASSGDSQFQLTTLGTASARYFDEFVHPGSKIGISGGNTIYEMMRALPVRSRDLKLYPTALIGRGPFIPEHIDPMVLLSILWEKSGRQHNSAFYVTVPPFERGTSPAQVRVDNESLKTRPKFKQVWTGMHEVDIVFASVGPTGAIEGYRETGRTLLRMLGDLGITEKWLQDEGVVGDISYSLFDCEGNTRVPDWDFFITLGIDYFREMAAAYPSKRVVMIAGHNKLSALRALLKGKLCNVLITDDLTAEALLRK